LKFFLENYSFRATDIFRKFVITGIDASLAHSEKVRWQVKSGTWRATIHAYPDSHT